MKCLGVIKEVLLALIIFHLGHDVNLGEVNPLHLMTTGATTQPKLLEDRLMEATNEEDLQREVSIFH